MSNTTNKKAINTATRVLANQVKMLEAQGHHDLYFNAQFYCENKKQNCVDRGQVDTISRQLRNYVRSENADTMNVELVESQTGKVIYRKKFSGLIDGNAGPSRDRDSDSGSLSGIQPGLGAAEVTQLVAKQLHDVRREDEIAKLSKETEELRIKYAALETEKEELAETLKAKQNLEFYSGIIGAAFPGLIPLFEGTPLAKAAGLLSGTAPVREDATPSSALSGDSDVQSTAAMIAEFCNTLTPKESSAMHLLCAAFEKDKNKIHYFLQQVINDNPSTNTQTIQHA